MFFRHSRNGFKFETSQMVISPWSDPLKDSDTQVGFGQNLGA